MRRQPHFKISRDFAGGPVVKNTPGNAKDTGLIPGPGTGIPHAMWCGTHTKSPEINPYPYGQLIFNKKGKKTQ